MARVAGSSLLPSDERRRLRLEDLLGFRRNPTTDTPLFLRYRAKALDGHPTPGTPFVRLATGASGVGVASSIGLAIGARDYYGENAPRVHIMEGEGGLTPGRVSEALAAAGTACLDNVVLHLDWNQSSIDSDRVTREGDTPGDYVQWDPIELFHLHDWNVVFVPDGHDFQQVFAAQRRALDIHNGQPTAIVYRTQKGWKYGVEGKASHGAGHGQCTDGFYQAMAELAGEARLQLQVCDTAEKRCEAEGGGNAVLEECFWEALSLIRSKVQENQPAARALAGRLEAARERLDARSRRPRAGAPTVEAAYEMAARYVRETPASLALEPGSATTLRQQLGSALHALNKESDCAFLVASADLLGSTSIDAIGAGFPGGYWNARSNPEARLLSVGGICEDAISGCSPASPPSARPSGSPPPTAPSWLRWATSRRASTLSAPRRAALPPASPTSPSSWSALMPA